MKWGSMIDGLEYCTGRKKSPANLNSVSRVVKFPEFIFYLFKYYIKKQSNLAILTFFNVITLEFPISNKLID